jgi:hypothetical protein
MSLATKRQGLFVDLLEQSRAVYESCDALQAFDCVFRVIVGSDFRG